MPYEHCADESVRNCSGSAVSEAPSSCPAKCADGSAPKLWKAQDAYAVAAPGDVEAMQRELMAHGPFEVMFFVFQDFMQYKSGVYTRSTAAAEFHPVGRHAVRVIGWGEEGGTPYWLVANSWSREFGENGYFRIRRGTNEAGIESKAGAGLPAM